MEGSTNVHICKPTHTKLVAVVDFNVCWERKVKEF